jgi:hypothetical protein
MSENINFFIKLMKQNINFSNFVEMSDLICYTAITDKKDGRDFL